MALTPVITRPTFHSGTEVWWSTLTHHVFSGMGSWVTTSSPADGAREIAEWNWTFPDSQTKSGAVVYWIPTATCTSQNVTLQVKTADGTTASTTLSVTVAAFPSSLFMDKFIRSDGNDTSGNVDDVTAYPRWEHAFGIAWPGGKANLSRVRGHAGMTVNWTNSFAGPDAGNVNAGPILLTKTSGTNPIMASTGGGLDLATNNADSGSAANPVIWDGIDFKEPSPQLTGIASAHCSTAFKNCTITNGPLGLSGSNDGSPLAGTNDIVVSVSILNALFTGIGCSAGSGSISFMVFDSVTSRGNGNHATQHHQCYVTSVTDFAIIDSTFDRNGNALAADGIKTSGSSRGYIARNTAIGNKTSFDVGGNPGLGMPGEICNDLVYDACISDGCTPNPTFWPDVINRLSIRNTRSYADASDFVQSWASTDPTGINGIDVFCSSVNGLGGNFFYARDDLTTGARIKGNAVVKAAASGPFYTFHTRADLAQFDIDYNCYWRTGNTPGVHEDTNFCVIETGTGSGTYSYTGWLTLIGSFGASGGKEAHSHFDDPLFTAAKNLLPTAGSPCINAGTPIGAISKDVVGTSRSLTTPTIGAFEIPGVDFTETLDAGSFTLSGQAMSSGAGEPADVGTFVLTGEDVAESAPDNFTSLADQGSFRLTGQNVGESNTAGPIPPPPSKGDTLSTYGPAMKEVYIQRKPGLFN